MVGEMNTGHQIQNPKSEGLNKKQLEELGNWCIKILGFVFLIPEFLNS